MSSSTASNRLARANYTFTAEAEISRRGTTHVPFVSPRAPFSSTFVIPTVLRQFGPLNANVHPIDLTHPPSRAHSRAPSAPPFQKDAESQDLGSRASSVAPAGLQGLSSRASSLAPRQSTPGPGAQGFSSRGSTPASAPSPSIPTSSVRSTRSATAAQREMEQAQSLDKFSTQAMASGVIRRPQSVPPANFADYLPPRSAPTSKRSASPAPTAAATSLRPANAAQDDGWDFDPMNAKRWTRPCAKSDEEKLKAASRKGKAPEENHETAWFQSRAVMPMVSPPDELSLRPDLELGDIFYHRSDQGIQLWMRVEDPIKGAYWKPSLLGEKREEDGRFLALTPGSKPTWNGKAWYRKKQASQPRVFVLNK